MVDVALLFKSPSLPSVCSVVQEAGSLDETPLVWVMTCEQLQEMLKELQTVCEFAVDLEVTV